MIQVGDICRVVSAPYESHMYHGLKVGDMVEVKEVHPHVVLVEKIGGNYRMRQCFKRNQWYRYLKKVIV